MTYYNNKMEKLEKFDHREAVWNIDWENGTVEYLMYDKTDMTYPTFDFAELYLLVMKIKEVETNGMRKKSN